MATLAADTPRTYEIGDRNDIGVIASDIIYEGAAVGENGSGYARPLTAGDKFLGFCEQKADNSAGAAGAINVTVKQRGRIQLAIASLAITDIGNPVYASDDDTFVLTQSTNSYIGRCIRFVSSGVGIVEFDASKGSLGFVTELTDSSGGTANNTVAAVSGSGADATINDNFADVTAKINAILRMIE